MSKNLIICNTLFQTYVALLLCNDLLATQENDLLFKVRNAEKTAQRIENENVFNSVYYADCSCQHAIGKQLLCKLSKCECIPKELLNKRYDSLFAFNDSCFEEEVFALLSKKNPDLNVIRYDEGLSSYIYQNKLDEKHNIISNILYSIGKIRGKDRKLSEEFRVKYLLEPALVGNVDSKEVLNKIPIKLDTEFINKMNCIFGYQDIGEYNDARVIVLDQPFDNDRQSNDDCELIKGIIRKLGVDKSIVRLHPRSRNRYSDLSCRVEQNKETPWETVVLNVDTENILFVTVTSSSCLTGSLLYRKKAHILLLYKLLPNIIREEEYADLDNYYQKAAEVLKIDIMVPKDEEELESILNEYR